MKTILLTGGAGFVGSNLALKLKQHFNDNIRVICLDNLKRRGSELNLTRLKKNGVEFVHGDIRNYEDLEAVGKVDCLLECSAEPSVLAGYGESPRYLINTNLVGTINCLEFSRFHDAEFIFLSTSRVYPIQTINQLNYQEETTRFVLDQDQSIPGVSRKGFSEEFPLEGPRSLYGSTKLCSEHLINEYVDMYGLRSVINRCGVLTGPWQMGKVDQGVTVLWVAKHIFGKPLSYIGYGGTGKQVRDLLHVDDLFDLVLTQIKNFETYNGKTFNVGGGQEISTSLQELTSVCEEVINKRIQMDSVTDERPADIRFYVTDSTRIQMISGWRPQRSVHTIVSEIAEWIYENERELKPLLS